MKVRFWWQKDKHISGDTPAIINIPFFLKGSRRNLTFNSSNLTSDNARVQTQLA